MLKSPSGDSLLKIPPFQDAHIHIMREGRPLLLSEGPAWADDYLSRGIVSLVDMGHKTGPGSLYKKLLAERERGCSLTIRTAGQALYKKGTYGGFLGKGVNGTREIINAIKEIAQSGADFLKIINSGIVSLQDNTPVTPGGFTNEEWRIIAEEAGLHKLTVRCHANGDAAIHQALSFGVASIEHGFFVSGDTLAQMAEEDVAWTPTGFALLSLKPFLPEKDKFFLEKIVDNHLKAVYDGLTKGIKVFIGTDSGSRGVRAGESFFKELNLLRQAGFTLDQILSAACLGPEELEKGNYLLVTKDFIEQERIESLYLGGRKVEFGPPAII